MGKPENRGNKKTGKTEIQRTQRNKEKQKMLEKLANSST